MQLTILRMSFHNVQWGELHQLPIMLLLNVTLSLYEFLYELTVNPHFSTNTIG